MLRAQKRWSRSFGARVSSAASCPSSLHSARCLLTALSRKKTLRAGPTPASSCPRSSSADPPTADSGPCICPAYASVFAARGSTLHLHPPPAASPLFSDSDRRELVLRAARQSPGAQRVAQRGVFLPRASLSRASPRRRRRARRAPEGAPMTPQSRAGFEELA